MVTVVVGSAISHRVPSYPAGHVQLKGVGRAWMVGHVIATQAAALVYVGMDAYEALTPMAHVFKQLMSQTLLPYDSDTSRHDSN